MSTLPNTLAAATDPRPPSPVGFGTPGSATAWVAFRRVYAQDGVAPDWLPAADVISRRIPGGNVTKRYSLGRSQDTLALDVEVESTADAAVLRSLVGTSATLILPNLRYDDSDYGTATAYPDGYAYRSQTCFLAAITASAITTRQTTKLSLSFERDPVTP